MIREKSGRLVAVLYDSADEPGKRGGEWTKSSNRETADLIFNKTNASDGDVERWLGAPSREEMETRLRTGWGEGADKLRTLASKEINPASIRRRRIRSDQGDEVDMQAVWRGDMSRAWTRTRRMSRPGTRSITLVCNMSSNWKQKSSDLFWRGAAALKLAEELSLAGYSVAIYGATGGTNVSADAKMDLVQFVEVKAEDAPLDVSALASLIAMPGYKRTRFHTGIIVQCDMEGREVDDGLGRPDGTLLPRAAKLLPIPQNAYFMGEVNSREAAERWIDEVLEAIESPVAA